MGSWQRWLKYAEMHGETPVAVVGAGYVGSNVVAELVRVPGVRPAIIANRTVATAVAAYVRAGFSEGDVVVSDDPAVLIDAVQRCVPTVCSSATLIPELPVSLVIESTGAFEYGAETILSCLEAAKDVISYNAEVDALLAYLFHTVAQRNGAVYTIADGDQPGVLLREIERITSLGFEVSVAVNCKRYLDIHQTPALGAAYVARDNTSSVMTTAFGDGTKMQVEMAVVANSSGLVPVQRGMTGICTNVDNAAFDIAKAVNAHGAVDFTLGGDFGAGVGVLATHPHPEIAAKSMRLYKMGEGPEYFFFRPYHLVHFELWETIADVVIDRSPLSPVTLPHVAEVVAMAKRDLAPGERLDSMGGYTVYGLLDSVTESGGNLPVGLSEYATVVRPIGIDQPVRLDCVALDDTPLVRRWYELKALSGSSWP